MEAYRILPWDSEFFGFNVARILPPALTLETLDDILDELGRGHVRLVYWATDKELPIEDVASRGGRLVDLKTTFSRELKDDSHADLASSREDVIVEFYDPSMPWADLRELAIQSGEFSRFSVDPKMPRVKFEELYTRWIEQSLAKAMADEVLVIREPGLRVAAMATLRAIAETGEVGLIAVDGGSRGRGYGTLLLQHAHRWFLDRRCRTATIITQGANLPACRLYEKCGYSRLTQSPFYHFWLDDRLGAC